MHCLNTDEYAALVVAARPFAALQALAADVRRIKADLDDFDGDRRGIADALYEARQRLTTEAYRLGLQLAQQMRDAGLVVEIRQVPLEPLKMGNHHDWVTITEARVPS